MDTVYDIVVIGAGPGGYVAAIRGAQLGLKVAVVEKDKPGGICLNLGCIPSKALIHQAELVNSIAELEDLGLRVDKSGLDYAKAFAKSRKAAERLSKGVQFLLKKNGIDYIKATATVAAPDRVELSEGSPLHTRSIILATGSRPRQLPGLPFDEQRVLSSSGALLLEKLPHRIAIIGGGAIGLELAYVWRSFGAEVTIIEALDRLAPLEDPEVSAFIAAAFRKQGINIYTATLASPAQTAPQADASKSKTSAPTLPPLPLTLALKAAAGSSPAQPGTSAAAAAPTPAPTPDNPGSLEVDAVLVAVGRVPNSENLGLEALGIRSERGFVETGAWCQTAARGIYAIGDLVNTPLLAHVASKEGELAAEHIAHVLSGTALPAASTIQRDTVPSAIYCKPEVGSFGLTEQQAKAAGRNVSSFSFPYRGIGKAVATEKADGFVKLVADAETGELLGAAIAGEQATELIHELLLAKQNELTVEEIADLMHAHPTLSEGVMEAARGVLGRAIHV